MLWFRPQKVVVCKNYVTYPEEVGTLLTHELIHAYDQCRAANLSWGDCEHHACSEVSNKRGPLARVRSRCGRGS